jgi:hypothetical protein
MTDLLAMAVEAHGGLERWSTVKTIDVELSIAGAIWHVKGRPDVLRNIAMRAEVGQERVVTTFADKDVRTTFGPDRVLIEKKDGTLIETRDEPERSFTTSRPTRPGTTCRWRTSAGKPSGRT